MWCVSIATQISSATGMVMILFDREPNSKSGSSQRYCCPWSLAHCPISWSGSQSCLASALKKLLAHVWQKKVILWLPWWGTKKQRWRLSAEQLIIMAAWKQNEGLTVRCSSLCVYCLTIKSEWSLDITYFHYFQKREGEWNQWSWWWCCSCKSQFHSAFSVKKCRDLKIFTYVNHNVSFLIY